jgi:hypothetical protein
MRYRHVKAIGGYFGLELAHGVSACHSAATVSLKSGRACLQYLLENTSSSTIWVPRYTCSVLYDPFISKGVDLCYYDIDGNLEIASPMPDLCESDALVYINYFGLKDAYVRKLENSLGPKLWCDHSQAFFYEPECGSSWHFNSARKWFGLPDGAFLYTPEGVSGLPAPESIPRNTDFLPEHLICRYMGNVEKGYPVFKKNEAYCGRGLTRMSELAESLLSHVDFESVAAIRRENYQRLHRVLGPFNQMAPDVLALAPTTVPFCYPYLPAKSIDRQRLWARNVFVPCYWPEIAEGAIRATEWERRLAEEMLPLPIDHRYGAAEMDFVAAQVCEYA